MKPFVLVAGALAAQVSLGDEVDIRLKGYVGDRLDALIERHVTGTDVDYITAPFRECTERTRRWQTEFWGKYMHAAVPYYTMTRSEKLGEAIDRGVDNILAVQEPSGYIGNYPDDIRCGEGWDVWGMKYTMMGLLHYYDGMKDAGGARGERAVMALTACKRLCDYVIAEIGPQGRRGRELWQTGNWTGYASSSILEPVVWLYKRVGEKKYLDFAAYIVKGMSEPAAGPRLVDLPLKGISVADRNGHGNTPDKGNGYVMKTNRWKAYEMMSCYQGLLEFYEVTGRKDLFDAALATANDIVKTEINLAGGCSCSEAWFHGATKQYLPYMTQQETCVTTTWMRFCQKLLDLTDDPKWADEIEKTFYNAYLASLKSDGSAFAGYPPLSGSRYYGQHHSYMHVDCCNSNGPRGFLCFLRELFKLRDRVATFNFYASAIARARAKDGSQVCFDMYSLYPRMNWARITNRTVGKCDLRLRIPAWSAKTKVELNGKELEGVKPGAYFTLSRDWKLGDVVWVYFDMPVVSHTLAKHYVAFTRGPILLARDNRFNDGDVSAVFRRRSFVDGAVQSTFTPVCSPFSDMWMTFAATLPVQTHHENPEGANPSTVFFCDYASAGNEWTYKNYYRTWFTMEFEPDE